MEIIECCPDLSTDRMYCPSTGEEIFAPEFDDYDLDAKAFIAYWYVFNLEEPYINDSGLKRAWEEYYNKWLETEDEENEIWDAVYKFLTDYENPEWKVYE